MIQLPPMEESEALVVLVALETLHQGLTNISLNTTSGSVSSQTVHELVMSSVSVSKRLRARMGAKPFVCVSEVRRRVGTNMASAMDALCALLVKRLQRMPRQAELAGRVAAEIKQLEEMWRAPDRSTGRSAQHDHITAATPQGARTPGRRAAAVAARTPRRVGEQCRGAGGLRCRLPIARRSCGHIFKASASNASTPKEGTDNG